MPYETLIDPAAVESRAALAVGGGEAPPRRARGARVALRRPAALSALQPRHRPHQRHDAELLRDHDDAPARIVDRPHRHTSAAINYYFAGRGRSHVEGKTYEWKAGDLMLSAPGWGVHNHASYDEPVYELTVQDQPFHLEPRVISVPA